MHLDESHQICNTCYKANTICNKLSGDKVVDNFIRHTQIYRTDGSGKMEVVPYDNSKMYNLFVREDLVQFIKPLGLRVN